MKSLKQVKVIGFPFAKSQVGIGAVNTPGWLLGKEWFQKLADKPQGKGLAVEVVDVKQIPNLMAKSEEGEHSDKLSFNQMQVAIENCKLLERHVSRAIKDGYFPIVLGGDNCQTLGSAQALQRVKPDTKTLWIDSMIDVNREGQQGFNSLELQTGMSSESQKAFSTEELSTLEQMKSQDLSRDIVFIGAGNDAKSLASTEYIVSKGGMVFRNQHCQSEHVEEMLELIQKHAAYQAMQEGREQSQPPFWMSCNMNALDSEDFRSKTRGNTVSTTHPDGVSLDFLTEFMKEFTCHSVGMDLSDVNFEITKETSQRHADEQTFRELFETVLASLNGPSRRASFFNYESRSQEPQQRTTNV